MVMKCPKCGANITWYDADIEVLSVSEKQVKVRCCHCNGKWIYKRKAK